MNIIVNIMFLNLYSTFYIMTIMVLKKNLFYELIIISKRQNSSENYSKYVNFRDLEINLKF